MLNPFNCRCKKIFYSTKNVILPIKKMTNVPIHVCEWGQLIFCLHLSFRWLPLDGSTYRNLNYIRMVKEQENLAGYLKCFFKVVCKNADLAWRAPQQYLAETTTSHIFCQMKRYSERKQLRQGKNLMVNYSKMFLLAILKIFTGTSV